MIQDVKKSKGRPPYTDRDEVKSERLDLILSPNQIEKLGGRKPAYKKIYQFIKDATKDVNIKVSSKGSRKPKE